MLREIVISFLVGGLIVVGFIGVVITITAILRYFRRTIRGESFITPLFENVIEVLAYIFWAVGGVLLVGLVLITIGALVLGYSWIH